jgi:hypothetical protein
MSVAANAIGEMPIGADRRPAASTNQAPSARRVAATADPVQQPEAR